MVESVWYKKIENLVLEQNEKLYKRDFKFYQVNTFLKLSEKLNEYSATCKSCQLLKTEAEDVATNLYEYLKGDVFSRKKYEKKITELNKHIKQVHRVYPKQYNASLFSFIGVLAGIAIGLAIAFLLNRNYIKEGIFFGFIVGLGAGRVFGIFRDNKLKKEGRILE